MGKYEQAYAKFTEKYDLNLNIQTEYDGANHISSIDDFSMDTSPEVKARNVYISTLSSALTDYIIKKVKIEPQKSYDLANIDIGGFITAFDDVMNAIRSDEAEKENTEYTHRKFEGLPMNRVANEAWARVAPRYNKPLHEIWAGQIRRGTLSLEQLQRITNSSTRLLDDLAGPNRSYDSAANKDLADVVMIKNAMAEAINKRSWTSWLNPFNWGPNRRENAYLKELDGKINTYRENKFPVDNVVPAIYTGNMLEGALGELQKTIGTVNQPAQPAQTAAKPEKKKEAKVQKKSEPAKKKANKKEAVKPISDKVMEAESNRFEEYIDDFCEYMKEAAGVNIGAYKMVIKMNIPNALGKMGTLNQNFENPVKGAGGGMTGATSSKEGVAPEDIVKEMATSCFDYFYGNSVSFGVSRGSDKNIAAAQAATNYLMSKFSPAVTDPEKYGKYADNYVLKDDKLLSEITGIKAGSKEITSARNMLHIKPEDVIKEADRTNLNLKSEDLEKKPVNQELSGKAEEAPVKDNNLIK